MSRAGAAAAVVEPMAVAAVAPAVPATVESLVGGVVFDPSVAPFAIPGAAVPVPGVDSPFATAGVAITATGIVAPNGETAGGADSFPRRGAPGG